VGHPTGLDQEANLSIDPQMTGKGCLAGKLAAQASNSPFSFVVKVAH
jgi:hypothetical protein